MDNNQFTNHCNAAEELFSEGHFCNVVNALPQMISYLDRDLIYRFVNDSYRRMFGVTPEQIIGRSLSELIGPDAWASASRYVDRVLSGEMVHYEETYEYKNAGRRIIKAVLIPDKIQNASVRGYWAVLEDVTEQRTFERELYENRAQFQAIADYTFDWESWIGPNGKLLWVNRAVEKLTGYTSQECLSMPDYPLPMVIKEDVPTVTTWLTEAQKGIARNDKEFRILHKDGTIHRMTISWQNLYDEKEKLLGYRTSVRDITNRQNLQDQQQRIGKMRSLGVLAGGVAHDFNNLHAIIMGNAELALMESERNDSLNRKLEVIINSARQASGLSDLMLLYSGQVHLDTASIDLNQLIQDSVSDRKEEWSEPTEIKLMLKEGLAPVCGDHALLYKALNSILQNANEAFDETAGLIEVSTMRFHANQEYLGRTYVHAVSKIPGHYAMVRICDHGKGINLENISRLFEPFYSTKFTGRGLGLAATLGIVIAHQGAIRVESSVGQGTTVEILLPFYSGQ